jgi:hypothetical protein
MLIGFTGCKGTHYFFNKVYKVEKILFTSALQHITEGAMSNSVLGNN